MNEPITPGEVLLSKENIILNAGKETVDLIVKNRAASLIGVGSHDPFVKKRESIPNGLNVELYIAVGEPKKEWDKAGYRLNIPAGDVLLLAPGEIKEVTVVKFGKTVP